MWSCLPSWKRTENSRSPMSLASPSVAATLPAVSEASDVVSNCSTSPAAAICWPVLSMRKIARAFESERRRRSTSFELLVLLLINHKITGHIQPPLNLKPPEPKHI